MHFQSLDYLCFYICVLIIGCFLINHLRLRLLFFTISSYFFYGFENYSLIYLLFFTTFLDYTAAILIERSTQHRQRKQLLFCSIFANLAVLGYFKYTNFFAESFISIAKIFGIKLNWVDINIILPVGISFYTFESMSYTIDVYKKIIPAERSFLKYAFFISFFPKLIAGPIVRPKDFLPQIRNKVTITFQDCKESFYFIFKGLYKKIILADFLSTHVEKVFTTSLSCDIFSAWIGVFAFSFQIYYDFSGYSDIATGCARLIGYRIPPNFLEPYIATSFSDFWRRWHISLSSWLKDYLYIPLGGNRTLTKLGTYRNLMITMLLGGLWHGASFTFVIWGFLHGFLLIIEKILGWNTLGTDNKKTSLFGRRIKIFIIITLTWITFRAQSLTELKMIVQKLSSFQEPMVITKGAILAIMIMVLGWISQLIPSPRKEEIFLRAPAVMQVGIYAIISFLVLALGNQPLNPFIYFQF